MSNTLFKIYILEDDEWFSRLINHAAKLDPEVETQVFGKAKDLYEALDKEVAHIVTLDYRLPDATGSEVLEKLKDKYPDTEFIMISEQQDVATAIALLHQGAYDYLVKDNNLKDRLLAVISKLKKQLALTERVKELEQLLANGTKKQVPFVGECAPIKEVKQLILKASTSPITVTITGETGTGKEVVAQYIHQNSDRAKKPFVAINMAAIPENLLESELFGYEKGAFTGADKAKPGKFEEANGGTLFLDEIAELPLALQSKLLRALQEKKLQRLGSNKELSFDCRIITASHKDLQHEVKAKRFREDLYFRLFGIQIELPPLRDRGSDIILLADFFIGKFAKENKSSVKLLGAEAKRKLKDYAWPGNIRELKAVIDLAMVMASEEEISAGDLHLRHQDLLDKELKTQKTLREYDIAIVKHYMEKFDDNTKRVADVLGIGQTTVYRMLKEDHEAVAK